MTILRRWTIYPAAVVALACLLGGAALSLAHPLSATLALCAFYGLLVLLWFKPDLWLFVVPAFLPIANLLPWTGWLMADEFDLTLMAVFAALYGRMALETVGKGPAGKPNVFRLRGRGWRGTDVLITLLALFSVASTWRGLSPDGWDQAWKNIRTMGLYDSYGDPANSLRQLKSLLFALLCLPLLRRQFGGGGQSGDGRRDEGQAARAFVRFGAGVLAGLAIVALVILWERLAYPGLFNFSSRYRTTALFWEMHVGGAAIDAYWVLTTPFVVWALARSQPLRHWLMWAVLALLVCNGVLTTFSRGVYVAVGIPLLLLGLFYAGFFEWVRRSTAQWQRPVGPIWRKSAVGGLLAVVTLEIWLVVAGGTFLADRVSQSEQDLDERLVHWQRGLDLLQSPTDWVIGKGVGRFPATYSQTGEESAFPGAIRSFPEAVKLQSGLTLKEPAFVRLSGPFSRAHIGLFMFNQRVEVPVAAWIQEAALAQKHVQTAARPGASNAAAHRAPLSVTLEARVEVNTHVWLKVCEKHLLYEGECLSRQLVLRPTPDGWQQALASLRPVSSKLEPAYWRRGAVLSILVFTPGAQLDLRNVRLAAAGGPNLLANADFSNGLAHWFPSATSYYLPWHIDNLYLEWLIERGAAGLMFFCALAGAVAHRLWRAARGGQAAAAVLLAALTGALLLGLVSSFLDVPRLAFFLFFLLFLGNELGEACSGEPEAG